MVIRGQKYKQAPAIGKYPIGSRCDGCAFVVISLCTLLALRDIEVAAFGAPCYETKTIYVKAE